AAECRSRAGRNHPDHQERHARGQGRAASGGSDERSRVAVGVRGAQEGTAVETRDRLSGRNDHRGRQIRRRCRMTRVALDSNVLIYAELEPKSEKGRRSAALILRAARDGVIPAQVLGEYLRFVQRRAPAAVEEAIRQASLYQATVLTPPTTDAVITKASALARAHRMQLWDCVVCVASLDADAKVLLTEDMQDGRLIEDLRLINPFAAANAEAIQAVLGE